MMSLMNEVQECLISQKKVFFKKACGLFQFKPIKHCGMKALNFGLLLVSFCFSLTILNGQINVTLDYDLSDPSGKFLRSVELLQPYFEARNAENQIILNIKNYQKEKPAIVKLQFTKQFSQKIKATVTCTGDYCEAFSKNQIKFKIYDLFTIDYSKVKKQASSYISTLTILFNEKTIKCKLIMHFIESSKVDFSNTTQRFLTLPVKLDSDVDEKKVSIKLFNPGDKMVTVAVKSEDHSLTRYFNNPADVKIPANQSVNFTLSIKPSSIKQNSIDIPLTLSPIELISNPSIDSLRALGLTLKVYKVTPNPPEVPRWMFILACIIIILMLIVVAIQSFFFFNRIKGNKESIKLLKNLEILNAKKQIDYYRLQTVEKALGQYYQLKTSLIAITNLLKNEDDKAEGFEITALIDQVNQLFEDNKSLSSSNEIQQVKLNELKAKMEEIHLKLGEVINSAKLIQLANQEQEKELDQAKEGFQNKQNSGLVKHYSKQLKQLSKELQKIRESIKSESNINPISPEIPLLSEAVQATNDYFLFLQKSILQCYSVLNFEQRGQFFQLEIILNGRYAANGGISKLTDLFGDSSTFLSLLEQSSLEIACDDDARLKFFLNVFKPLLEKDIIDPLVTLYHYAHLINEPLGVDVPARIEEMGINVDMIKSWYEQLEALLGHYWDIQLSKRIELGLEKYNADQYEKTTYPNITRMWNNAFQVLGDKVEPNTIFDLIEAGYIFGHLYGSKNNALIIKKPKVVYK